MISRAKCFLLSVLVLLTLASQTLATDITVASFPVQHYRLTAGPASPTVRFYASETFTASDGRVIVGAPAGSAGFYASTTCTLVGQTATCAAVILPPTTDSSRPNATYAAVLFDGRGQNVATLFARRRLSHTLVTPTTYAAWEADAASQPRPFSPTYPTNNDVDTKISAALSAGSAATVSALGRIKTSIAPTDAANPVAVVTNDPRVGETLYASKYATLALALAAAVDKTLVVDSAVSVTTNVTIPATVELRFTKSGYFNISTGVVVTILADLNAPRAHIFRGAGTVKFTGAYPEPFKPEWWGAAGDGSTDDLAEFDAMEESMMKDNGAGLPVGGWVLLQGGKTYKHSDTWHIRRNIHLSGSAGRDTGGIHKAENKVGIVLHSLSSFNGVYAEANGRALNTVIENLTISAVPGTTTNSTVTLNDWTVTRTAGTAFDQTASVQDGNTILINGHDYLIQAIGSASQITLQDRQPIRLDAAGGGTVVTNIGYQKVSPDWIGMNVSIAGEKRTISAVTAAAPAFTDFGYGATLTLTGAPVQSISLTAIGSGYTSTPTCTISGGGGTGAECSVTVNLGSGQVTGVTLDDEGYGYTSLPTVAITGGGGVGATASLGAMPAANVPTFSGTGFLTGGFTTVLGSKSARMNIYHGIDLRTSAVVRNVQIQSFHGNGLNSNSTQTPSFNLSAEPNSNVSLVERVSADFNSGNGFYLKGVNSNASVFTNISMGNNHGYGVYDNSFLGNTYLAPHGIANYLGGYYTTQGLNNVTTMLNPYHEGDTPANRFGRLTTIITANLANGEDETVEAAKKLGVGATVDSWLQHGGISRGNLGEPPKLLTIADTLGTVSTAFTYYLANTSGGAINFNLPPCSADAIGRRFIFKRTTGASDFTVFATGGSTINGAGSVVTNTRTEILCSATNIWNTL